MKIVSAQEFDLRREVEYGSPEQNEAVRAIVKAVKEQGDAALLAYTEKFDGMKLEAASLRVTQEELKAAYDAVEPSFVQAIAAAADNIRRFHVRQKRNSWMDLQPDGSLLGQIIRPLKRVGVYVPGGKAAYPSSVLMNVIPAQVAGVPEIVMVTPPATGGKAGIDPYILVAAAEAGVHEIYRAGGRKRSPRSLTARTRSRPSIKSAGRATSTSRWPNAKCTGPSISTASPARAKSPCWPTTAPIPPMWRRICCPRPNTMKWRRRSW